MRPEALSGSAACAAGGDRGPAQGVHVYARVHMLLCIRAWVHGLLEM